MSPWKPPPSRFSSTMRPSEPGRSDAPTSATDSRAHERSKIVVHARILSPASDWRGRELGHAPKAIISRRIHAAVHRARSRSAHFRVCRARSSVGQSRRLIIVWSLVRSQPGPPSKKELFCDSARWDARAVNSTRLPFLDEVGKRGGAASGTSPTAVWPAALSVRITREKRTVRATQVWPMLSRPGTYVLVSDCVQVAFAP